MKGELQDSCSVRNVERNYADTLVYLMVHPTSTFQHSKVTNGMIPASIPIQLNTSYFATVAPGLAKAHPNAGMVLQFDALPAPVNTSANPSGLNVSR